MVARTCAFGRSRVASVLRRRLKLSREEAGVRVNEARREESRADSHFSIDILWCQEVEGGGGRKKNISQSNSRLPTAQERTHLSSSSIV